MQFWIRNLFDPGSGMTNLDPGSGMNIPDPQHCRYYFTLFFMYSVIYTTASDAHNSSIIACFLIYSVPRFSNMKSLNQGVTITKRCRLSLLTNSALVYESLYAGSKPMSTAVRPNKLRRSTSIFNLWLYCTSILYTTASDTHNSSLIASFLINSADFLIWTLNSRNTFLSWHNFLRPHIHKLHGTITPNTRHPRILLTSLFNLSETLALSSLERWSRRISCWIRSISTFSSSSRCFVFSWNECRR